MTRFEDWRDAVLSSTGVDTLEELEKPLGASGSTYPLLVPETSSGAEATPSETSWTVRVVLREDSAAERFSALDDPWTEVLVGEEEEAGETLESFLPIRLRSGEARVEVDLQMLRNVAEIRRLKLQLEPELKWVLVSRTPASADPEELVGETIRQLTGVLAGCDLLEIRQGSGEEFGSVWSRLNVARIMAAEAELRGNPDPIAGAGLFEELQRRL